MSSTSASYALLSEKLKEIEVLNGIRGLLGWDEMTMLPAGAASCRAVQKSVLAGLIYQKETCPHLKKILQALEDEDLSTLPSDYERAVVRDAVRDFEFVSRKSKELTVRESELESQGYQLWNEARNENNFAKFSPILQEIVCLKREVALSTRPQMEPFDASIDAYERGMKSARLLDIFSSVKAHITPLIGQILQSEAKRAYIPPPQLLGGDVWCPKIQAVMCREIAQAIGFDFSKGRLDVSVHPFTGGSHPSDVRITTRYSSENWLEGLAGVVHEVGHGLYEQGRNESFDLLPVSRPLSMGTHESQSLFWERMIFQSREFWEWAVSVVHRHFPHTEGCDAEDFYRFVNQVDPGFIRIEADELTYPLHVALRVEVEQALMAGTLSAAGVPAEWARKMREGLSLEVPSDAKGCLQDIHWSLGYFGYFGTYSLGAMAAAQLFKASERDIPDLRNQIRQGQFAPVREWLRVNVHAVGSLHPSTDELLRRVTGTELDPQVFTDYLTSKYAPLYNLSS